jgi:hypothetical protein
LDLTRRPSTYAVQRQPLPLASTPPLPYGLRIAPTYQASPPQVNQGGFGGLPADI